MKHGAPIKTDALTQNDIDKIAGLLDEKERLRKIEALEKWAVQVGEKVGVKLKIQ